MPTFVTIYCGQSHRISDGIPLEHSCRVLAPAFLAAERVKDFDRAIEILAQMPLTMHEGLVHSRKTRPNGDDIA
jgi:hypothetical protein